jgi:hypothetical protein
VYVVVVISVTEVTPPAGTGKTFREVIGQASYLIFSCLSAARFVKSVVVQVALLAHIHVLHVSYPARHYPFA